MSNRRLGILLAGGSLLIGLIDRFTAYFSSSIGKAVCGDRYLLADDGMLSESSCGFDMDMYLLVFLLFTLLAGVALLYREKKKR